MKKNLMRCTRVLVIGILLIFGFACNHNTSSGDNSGGNGSSGNVAVTSIQLEPALSLTVGETKTLKATVLPSNATYTPKWESDNSPVATVNQSGIVEAKKPGTATITVKTADGKCSAQCTITVSQVIKIESITLNKTAITLGVGKEKVLIAGIVPENATNKELKWESNDSSVAEVDQSGKVTAKSAGSATITVNTKDNQHPTTCTVTVKNICRYKSFYLVRKMECHCRE